MSSLRSNSRSFEVRNPGVAFLLLLVCRKSGLAVAL